MQKHKTNPDLPFPSTHAWSRRARERFTFHSFFFFSSFLTRTAAVFTLLYVDLCVFPSLFLYWLSSFSGPFRNPSFPVERFSYFFRVVLRRTFPYFYRFCFEKCQAGLALKWKGKEEKPGGGGCSEVACCFLPHQTKTV